jgi:carotenoid cleavage dioxygenase
VKSGPNPALAVSGPYHWFDGDGMLHGIRLKDAKANYSNMQIETARLQNERRLGMLSSFE